MKRGDLDKISNHPGAQTGGWERERERTRTKKKEYITTSCPLLYCLLSCSRDTAIKIPLSWLTFIFSPPRPINTASHYYIRHLKQALCVEESNRYVCEMQCGMHSSCPIKKVERRTKPREEMDSPQIPPALQTSLP